MRPASRFTPMKSSSGACERANERRGRGFLIGESAQRTLVLRPAPLYTALARAAKSAPAPRPSSRGLGRRPFTAKTGVRIPLGAPSFNGRFALRPPRLNGLLDTLAPGVQADCRLVANVRSRDERFTARSAIPGPSSTAGFASEEANAWATSIPRKPHSLHSRKQVMACRSILWSATGNGKL
jgi:hypothetical protein